MKNTIGIGMIGLVLSAATMRAADAAPGTQADTNATVITHGVVNMRAVGAPKGSAASVTGTMQWRLKGDTSWNDMPATISAGATETVATGAFDSEAILAANPTLPQRTSVVFEIRARFVYGGSSMSRVGRWRCGPASCR